ncbi:MAG: small ligand-binding sensory domain FIST [Gammaproteobacteria bacterium]|jgi:small ligand-binding sensory domain FIST
MDHFMGILVRMKWTSNLSRNADFSQALEDVTGACLNALDASPDLTFVFASGHFRNEFERLPAALRERLGPTTLLGCSATGVIGDASEAEQEPALSITAATLPDVTINCWHVAADDLRPGTQHNARCTELAQQANGAPEQFIVLADPFSFPAEQLLRALESGFKTSAIAGGLASGGQAAGEIVLFLDDAMHTSGAILLGLGGNIEMVTAVAQGCRPIGDPMFVSTCNGNKLSALDGKATNEVLNELFTQSDSADRELMQHSLFLGITMQPGASRYAQGDFLIRNIAGTDTEDGGLWVGANLRENQVVQFHVRDANTSSEDLERNLIRLADELGETPPSGGLLFSCIGRGRGLYGQADHDSAAVQTHLGQVPLGGFFCNGEIGPVTGTTYLHGYTSALAMFRAQR